MSFTQLKSYCLCNITKSNFIFFVPRIKNEQNANRMISVLQTQTNIDEFSFLFYNRLGFEKER